MRLLHPLLILGLSTIALGACTTTGGLPPTQAVRYHPADVARGTVAIEPATPEQPSLEFQAYADAVRAELLRNGYTPAAAGTPAQFTATVDLRRRTELGPPRRSPISIGIGGGGFSGGRGGGVGLGGGVGFPIGGGGRREVIVSELAVAIRDTRDQARVWEGSAQSVTDARAPDATAPSIAARLAGALFTRFPGESGRTIEVR